ncbi:MAG: chorismate mutase [Candidatus Sericytochromatia bacterium]|nr:chorismate mutase [Candidatus Sericytochromatia bacterium]
MMVRGIRGAISVPANTAEAIYTAARELLEQMMQQNDVVPDAIASVFLTCTTDLNAAFPAYAARQMDGFDRVPLLGAQEMDVPGGLPSCLRILLQVNTERGLNEIRHLYLGEAAKLRPDLTAAS